MKMSFQDFSLVSEDDPSFTLKSIQKDIEKLKVQFSQKASVTSP